MNGNHSLPEQCCNHCHHAGPLDDSPFYVCSIPAMKNHPETKIIHGHPIFYESFVCEHYADFGLNDHNN